jgi:octaprenyl-diphosphate synthase
MLERTGALKATLERARGYGAVARQALDAFADGPAKSALAEAVDFAVGRAY